MDVEGPASKLVSRIPGWRIMVAGIVSQVAASKKSSRQQDLFSFDDPSHALQAFWVAIPVDQTTPPR